MPTFTYQAIDAKGGKRLGEVHAQSRGEALRKLALERIQPLSLLEGGGAAPSQAVTKSASRAQDSSGIRGGVKKPTPPARKDGKPGIVYLSNKQIVFFTDELSDFLGSGMQLESALHLMENREEKSNIKTLATLLRERVRDGTRFSDALRQTCPSLGEMYYNLVAAGEESGALGPLLKKQAVHLAELRELRDQVTAALIYPAFLGVAGIVALVVFMTVLVPQMSKLFKDSGASMPLPTYVLFKVGQFSQFYGVQTIIIVLILVLSFFVYIRQPSGKLWWDRAKLSIPLFGDLWLTSFHGEFCQMLANLLGNGLPLVSALRLVGRATGNVFLNGAVTRMGEMVSEGVSLTQTMKSSGQFPSSLRDLVKVGEQTGDLSGSLQKIGLRYEKLIKRKMDGVVSLIQPVIILLLGCVIGLVAWSMLSGIYGAMKAMRGQG